MRLHANAALTLKQRERMVRHVVDDGWSLARAARAAEVSDRTCSKWVVRYRAAGRSGLTDRSSAPHRVANRTDEQTVQLLVALRRLRFTAPELADLLELPCSTISGVLKRIGMGKLGRLGLEPAVRYERQRPGELIHIDVKKLGRIQGGAGKRITAVPHNRRLMRTDRAGVRRATVGWDAVHVAIDDATRLAYAEVLSDEQATTAVAFLSRAIAFYERHGITVKRVLTDNGSPYVSTIHAIACRAHSVRHLRTRPYRPQTNGKAERFIRTMLGGWAYNGLTYGSSAERARALDGWLWEYNHRRRHQALGRQTPISRLNNLLGTYS